MLVLAPSTLVSAETLFYNHMFDFSNVLVSNNSGYQSKHVFSCRMVLLYLYADVLLLIVRYCAGNATDRQIVNCYEYGLLMFGQLIVGRVF